MTNKPVERETSKEEKIEQTSKRRRRGINKDTRSSNRIKYDVRDMVQGSGLFQGICHELKLDYVTIGEDKDGMPSFTGMKIPRITITFKSPEPKEENLKRFVSKTFMPVESNVETMIDGKNEWKVTGLFSFMKHIITVMVTKGAEVTEEMEDLLTLPFEDSDEDGNFIDVGVETVIAGYEYVFKNFVNIINNDGSPYYKTKDGKDIIYWLKLIKSYKAKGVWRNNDSTGELGFPNYVGEGIIEVYKPGILPSLRLMTAKERLSLAPEQKTNNTSKQGIYGGAVLPGSGVELPQTSGMGAYGAIPDGSPSFESVGNEDMPF